MFRLSAAYCENRGERALLAGAFLRGGGGDDGVSDSSDGSPAAAASTTTLILPSLASAQLIATKGVQDVRDVVRAYDGV